MLKVRHEAGGCAREARRLLPLLLLCVPAGGGSCSLHPRPLRCACLPPVAAALLQVWQACACAEALQH